MSIEREALAAVLEAMDIPYAATAGEHERRSGILERRTMIAVNFLRDVLDPADTCPDEIRLRVFRDMLADHPATGYVTHEQARARLAEGADWSEAVRPVADAS